jgi:hypothetical protein
MSAAAHSNAAAERWGERSVRKELLKEEPRIGASAKQKGKTVATVTAVRGKMAPDRTRKAIQQKTAKRWAENEVEAEEEPVATNAGGRPKCPIPGIQSTRAGGESAGKMWIG